MERWACVDIPSLALQLLLVRNPSWRAHPVAIVDRDAAQGTILEVNAHARALEIRPGLRYATALSLHSGLRAAVVDDDELSDVHEKLFEHLLEFSPHVEPSPHERGLFWLRATGLDKLFGSFEAWLRLIHDETATLGYRCAVVLGWTRFGTYAAARDPSHVGCRHLSTAEEERRIAEQVPLDVLGLETTTLDALRKLAIERVAEFLALPPSGVRKRFGARAYELWRLARGEAELPLQPRRLDAPIERTLDLDEAIADWTQVVFLLKRAVHPMLLELAGRHRDLVALHVTMRLEDGDEREFTIRPAVPTLDENRVLELARLELERLSLPSPIVRLELSIDSAPYRREQVHLLRRSARRDPQAAAHALARLQAEYGERAVSRVVPRARHLPEESFELVPWSEASAPSPPPRSSPTLARRIHLRPRPLPRFTPEPSHAWLIRDLDEGLAERFDGPFRLTDAWWLPGGYVARDYWFAHTKRGDIFWLYWDHLRRQWFMHGVVS